MTISELIQQEAAKTPFQSPISQDCYVAGFEAGANVMVEHIIGFAIWLDENAARCGADKWQLKKDNFRSYSTTQEALDLYLGQLNPPSLLNDKK